MTRGVASRVTIYITTVINILGIVQIFFSNAKKGDMKLRGGVQVIYLFYLKDSSSAQKDINYLETQKNL